MVRPTRLNADRQSCQDEACAIQSCLSRTSYDQSKCEAYVQALYRCCDRFYKAVDAQAVTNMAGVERPEVDKSTACPIRSVVERKMKQMEGR